MTVRNSYGLVCSLIGLGLIFGSVYAQFAGHRDLLKIELVYPDLQSVVVEKEFTAPLRVENQSSKPVRIVGLSWC